MTTENQRNIDYEKYLTDKKEFEEITEKLNIEVLERTYKEIFVPESEVSNAGIKYLVVTNVKINNKLYTFTDTWDLFKQEWIDSKSKYDLFKGLFDSHTYYTYFEHEKEIWGDKYRKWGEQATILKKVLNKDTFDKLQKLYSDSISQYE